MPDLYDKIESMQGGLEDLARKIPGFKGYLEKEDRREADKLLREQIVRVFEGLETQLNQHAKRLVDAGGLAHMERVQSVNSKFRTFIDRVESAPRGYAGLFDAIKVKEAELARLYAFDNALLDFEGRFETAIEQFGAAIDAGEGIEAAVAALDDLMLEANETFKERVDVLTALAV